MTVGDLSVSGKTHRRNTEHSRGALEHVSHRNTDGAVEGWGRYRSEGEEERCEAEAVSSYE